MKKINFTVPFIFLCAGLFNFVFADSKIQFEFKQKKGDSVVHIATVNEEAYLNNRLVNKIEFINRIATTVLEKDKDGKALLETHYMTTEKRQGTTLEWKQEESTVQTYRTKNGEIIDPDNEFMPTVRNVPCFPDYKVAPGDSWQADGMEVHDLCELFNMSRAVKIPFTAKYTYIGDEENLNVIECYYEIFQDAQQDSYYSGSLYAGAEGYANQKIYWDQKKGDLDHYTEEFQIQMYDVYGNSYTFVSEAEGKVTEYHSVNDDENLKKIEKSIKKMKLDDVSVQKSEKGLTISIENIQFEADSDKLRASEKTKLRKIADLLKEYNNDLLITGHCAERGTVNARQKLSESRAEAVADYLQILGVRDEYHIFTQGKGSTEPIASNETEAGRAKNRRVEITIMD